MTSTDPTVAASSTADTSPRRVFTPSGLPGAAVFGAVLGAALLVLCGVAVRDLVVRAGWAGGDPWLGDLAHRASNASWDSWTWPAVIALLVVGATLLGLSAKPRKPTHLRLAGHEVVWTRRVDVARRCSAAADDVAGVDRATTVVTRRRVTSTVYGRDTVDEAAVRAAVDAVVAELDSSPRVRVRFVRRDGSRR
ncbi:hypothetical protein nbrc107696_11230 [Gordonia spumicola]|uniref:Alkaline shock response membrane anchor protein AmaP n=1 Tax=Gordonia spumicola TaxID=589161 RepID=A0A7I9V5Z3_9ACTN|nr:DUF6286 domain-containing protein [Gordonia spumicola]GEE00677.1 hypothetical protein nbrc107696_11230 [Gordonia spumicola]